MAAPDCRLVETTERVCSVQTILNTNNATVSQSFELTFLMRNRTKLQYYLVGKFWGKY